MIKIVLVTLCSAVLSTSFAQSNMLDMREQFTWGIKAGVNGSDISNAQGVEFQSSPQTGLAAGFIFSIPFSQWVGIQPELLFSQKGFQATGKILESNYDLTRTTNYLAIPLLISFKPSRMLTLITGPQYSYLLKKNDVFKDPASSIVAIQEFRNEKIRTSSLSYLGGFDMNINHVIIGTRVGWDISTNNNSISTTTPRYRNLWYQATLAYRLAY